MRRPTAVMAKALGGALTALLCVAGPARAADPGLSIPTVTEASDLRRGNVLLRIYPGITPMIGAAFFTGPTGSINLPASTLAISTLTIPVTARPC